MNTVVEPMPLEGYPEPNPDIKRIVVATDLSEHGMKTTNYALGLAKKFGASLTLVHVFEPKEISLTVRFAIVAIAGVESVATRR